MALKPLGTGQGYLKAGFLGFPSSGKTYTGIQLAIGTRNYLDLKGPIAMFDTESGSEYIAEVVKKQTKLDLVGEKSHAFDDLMRVGHDCVKEGVSVLVVDSITHVWREICEAHLLKANRMLQSRGRNPKTNLEFQDWGPIKRKWSTWTDFYLNSPLHIIICGRAGFEYDNIENEQSGKKELIKTGTKMKAESEFGFEPSLLIEMERVHSLKNKKTYERQAVVLKDRFNLLDGKSCLNPTFKFFQPYIDCLKPGSLHAIDQTVKSTTELDELGRDDYDRKRKDREIVLEELQNEMLKRWPSRGADDQKMKIKCLEYIFGTNAWAKVEITALDTLRMGLKVLKSMDDKGEIPPPAEEIKEPETTYE